jgi:acyl-CoA synthetase (AMP-forming)/AMP-acid ligase II
LPGVEVKIIDPDETGVGEVVARGPNIMMGYFENDAATRATIVDRWLRTGDLGRFDADNNLYLVGRSKEIIVDTNGKNVYPDEIEEIYGNSSFIKELSVVGLPDGAGEKSRRSLCPTTIRTCRFRAKKRGVKSKNIFALSHPQFPLQARQGASLFRRRTAAHGDPQS